MKHFCVVTDSFMRFVFARSVFSFILSYLKIKNLSKNIHLFVRLSSARTEDPISVTVISYE